MVAEITAMEEDFAKWYTDVVKKADLVEYSSVKGCMIIKPAGYAIWENIYHELDKRFKRVGVKNVYMPLFIPESLLNKEKDHIEGFAPEVAWVTKGGNDELEERMCVRPTSEVLFCDFYSKDIESYRDLPRLYNQWCSVVRWEKTTRPFLRTREFLWQEGHTAHETAEDAKERTYMMLDVYSNFLEDFLAIPTIKGRKTDKEKFAGAEFTLTIESLMHDKKTLQSATSHYFGDGFAKAFDITYTDRNNKLSYVHQTSWGITTRVIGALIMVHSDNSGLVLPPKVAPVKAMIIPIMQKKEGVLEKCREIQNRLLSKFDVEVDDTNKTPGYKFSEQEMRGIPVRIEIGPRDIEQNTAVVVRRDNREKIVVNLDNIEEELNEILEKMQNDMLERAKKHLNDNIITVHTMDDMEKHANDGFLKAMWCGNVECEENIKEKFSITSRCIPYEQDKFSDKCVCCGNEAKYMTMFGKAY